MKIDHVAMYVRNLEAVKDFFVRFFGAVSNEMYHNPRTGLKLFPFFRGWSQVGNHVSSGYVGPGKRYLSYGIYSFVVQRGE